MPVRTQRLGLGVTPGADVAGTAYTCPAGETTILKDWRIGTPGGNTCSRAIVYLSSGGVVVPLFDGALAAFDTRGGTPWVVLHPGDELQVLAATHPGFQYWLSGTELHGVAD